METAPLMSLTAWRIEFKRAVLRHDIWIADLPLRSDSHVQGGNRPVIVISNNAANAASGVVSIIPLTTKMKKLNLPTHILVHSTCLNRQSMAECEQIQLIDKKLLRRKIGHIDLAEERKALEAAIAFQLGLNMTEMKWSA